MAESVVLNNYSDDSQIKSFINNNLMPRVFKNIPLNVLNMGEFSIINEYLSQGMENLAFTSSFYFNESFITKAVLPDSIFAEAALFNLGYSFATPSACNMLLELNLDDIYRNATLNSETGLYEFILDKDTIINLLDNGNEYSLDYDILIQYRNVQTSESTAPIPAWNCQYTNMDELNVIATNKDRYITYRVTTKWLCLFIQVNEYKRTKYVVTNNTTSGIATSDKLITCTNHICGFDVKYVDTDGTYQWIPHDHILPIHSNVTDNEPYIHYVMDNPQTIRFMFQLDGPKRFTPTMNSRFEIYVYTCHGEAANFKDWDNEESQPKVISKVNKYPNNANVLKACFVLAGGSFGGTNIGTVETVRRETIEAYNTVHVLSTDHDLDEWMKTFYFKNVLYPYFFKRRDDPWGRIWSGYLALKDDDDYVYRTNTLHAYIPYNVLYSNNENTVTNNEIIIPPGWTWVYNDYNERMTLHPITKTASNKVETVKSLDSYPDKFVFANPFGIRIQKEPFAMGYFNPWVNQFLTTTNVGFKNINPTDDTDPVVLYHATAVYTEIQRLYKDDYYRLTTFILPSIDYWGTRNNSLVPYLRRNATEPAFVTQIWNYFQHPLDLYAPSIPMIALSEDEDGYLPYDKEKTYFCVETKNQIDGSLWSLQNIWIDDYTSIEHKRVYLPINGEITRLVGSNDIWGTNGICKDYSVYSTGITDINIYPVTIIDKGIEFGRVQNQNYYRMGLDESAATGRIRKIAVDRATLSSETAYGENRLYRIGDKYNNVYLNIHYDDGTVDAVLISNAAVVYTPYKCVYNEESGMYEIDMQNVSGGEVIVYAEMKPAADSGSIEYYRVPFSVIEKNTPLFSIENKLLPVADNNMRVIISASINGAVVGYTEMQPVSRENDGSYRYDVQIYPLNELVDIDDRIAIASTDIGGGSWISLSGRSAVTVNASDPKFKISILVRTETPNYESEVYGNSKYDGFRIVDEYTIDSFELVQELKEMRSIVDFGDSTVPSKEQMSNYNSFISLYNPSAEENNIYTLYKYAYDRTNGMRDTYPLPYDEVVVTATNMLNEFDEYLEVYQDVISSTVPTSMTEIADVIKSITESKSETLDDVDWDSIATVLQGYVGRINNAFSTVDVNGGVNIQLVPFVESSLMVNKRFGNFVESFVNVHKVIEPVIFNRLDGNHYLDCKLIATYGLPHTYCTDIEKMKNLPKDQTHFWPNLAIQISFDVKFKNPALTTNTTDELKNIVKSYFNKLTTLHTSTDTVSMNNNIYISRLIHEMGKHDNVEYLKFNGFYTDEAKDPNGDYMDANIQVIVQRWDTLEDFPKYSSNGKQISELENFVPEMFVLDNDSIIINSI